MPAGWHNPDAAATGGHQGGDGFGGGSHFSLCESTAALLIDSPGVLGPLPDPCRSPTFRSLAQRRRHSGLSLGKGGQPAQPLTAKALSFGSAHSYSGGRIPILDSVTSLHDEPLGRLESGSGDGGNGGGAGGALPATAATLLRHAELAYDGGRLPAAPAMPPCSTPASGHYGPSQRPPASAHLPLCL